MISESGKIKLIGDVHLGRKFKTGVPLNRRGELEEKFFDKFTDSFRGEDVKTHVWLGDLFDSPIIDNDVLFRAYSIIDNMARIFKEKKFYFIAGNHDLNKDTAAIPAIRILSEMLKHRKNVFFVLEKPVCVEDATLVPWSYSIPVEEQFVGINTPVVCGHFEEPLSPTVANYNGKVYSGHIHKAHDNGNVTFVGSILPIAFGEESDDKIMCTMTLEELNNTAPESLKNKRVRIILKEGETLPSDLDCLQLIAKKEESEESNAVLEVTLEDFDFKELFMKELNSSGKAEELWEKYLLLKNGV